MMVTLPVDRPALQTLGLLVLIECHSGSYPSPIYLPQTRVPTAWPCGALSDRGGCTVVNYIVRKFEEKVAWWSPFRNTDEAWSNATEWRPSGMARSFQFSAPTWIYQRAFVTN